MRQTSVLYIYIQMIQPIHFAWMFTRCAFDSFKKTLVFDLVLVVYCPATAWSYTTRGFTNQSHTRMEPTHLRKHAPVQYCANERPAEGHISSLYAWFLDDLLFQNITSYQSKNNLILFLCPDDGPVDRKFGILFKLKG